MKKLEKIIQIVINACLVFSLIVITFCLSGFLQLKVLHKPYIDLFGYTIFSVATGSMRPTLEVHDIIIVKITDDIKVGDIITYHDNKDFITHRVVSNNDDVFITKGDYNNTEDNPIDSSKIVGKMVCKISNLGVFGEILLTPKVFVSVVITLFLFMVSFSYVPKKKLETKETDNKDNKDTLVTCVQSSVNPSDVKKISKEYDEVLKKKVDLEETAELFLNLKSIEKEKEIIEEKLISKNKLSKDNKNNNISATKGNSASKSNNISQENNESKKSSVKNKKKIDLDATCEYVFAFNQEKKKQDKNKNK